MIFVLIGTTAELIKLTPVILALQARSITVVPIATGQNDLRKSDLYQIVFPNGIDHWITHRPIHQTTFSFLWWTIECFLKSPFLLKKIFRQKKSVCPYLIVHGDTVSTLIGALSAWLAGAKIVHVEAGLRSFHLLRPFPEEMCRILVSKFTTLAFCPGKKAVGNLRAARGLQVIDTCENTLIDSLRFALSRPLCKHLTECLPKQFFVSICHRQENLLDKVFLQKFMQYIENASQKLPCVTILHKPALQVFRELGMIERLEKNSQIISLPRQGYIDFTHILQQSDYVLTDGGSNQEECYYLGKPCLLLRRETERDEGLGENVVLSHKKESIILQFLSNPSQWKRDPPVIHISPSELIAETLSKLLTS